MSIRKGSQRRPKGFFLEPFESGFRSDLCFSLLACYNLNRLTLQATCPSYATAIPAAPRGALQTAWRQCRDGAYRITQGSQRTSRERALQAPKILGLS